MEKQLPHSDSDFNSVAFFKTFFFTYFLFLYYFFLFYFFFSLACAVVQKDN
jgi:hypothetical protein